MLDPDVSGHADLGGTDGQLVDVPGVGTVRQRPPISGRNAVARLALHYLGPDSSTTLLALPTGDESTVIALRDYRVLATLTLIVQGDRITHMHGVIDPAKLVDLNLILDA